MSIVHRIIPIGVLGIVMAIVLFNTVWTSGLALGVYSYHNQSVDFQEELTEFNNQKQNITTNATQNLTPKQEALFKTVYGVSIEQVVDGMFMYANGGIRFGYQHPELSTVLVKYRLPIILPVASYLVLRYRTIQGVTRFVVGSIK